MKQQNVCEFCLIVDNKVEAENLYEDQVCRAVLHLKPSSPGHVLIFSKQHSPIFEQVPDELVSHLFIVANKLGGVLFDALNIHGTNFIIENGVAAGQKVAHFSINIVPRTEQDDLNLQWQPKPANADELDEAQQLIKDALTFLESGAETKKETQKTPTSKAKSEPGDINYLVERLKRIP